MLMGYVASLLVLKLDTERTAKVAKAIPTMRNKPTHVSVLLIFFMDL
jgi:hypothetical protein